MSTRSTGRRWRVRYPKLIHRVVETTESWEEDTVKEKQAAGASTEANYYDKWRRGYMGDQLLGIDPLEQFLNLKLVASPSFLESTLTAKARVGKTVQRWQWWLLLTFLAAKTCRH